MTKPGGTWRLPAGGRGLRLLAVWVTLLWLGLSVGCFDTSPGGPRPGGDGGQTTPDGGDDGDSPDGEVQPPSVRLTASNLTPQPGEELQLRCEVTAGASAGVTFDFAPDLAGFVLNRQAGTASLVIEDIDVGIAYSFTCTGTNTAGTGPASDAVVVIATDVVGPAPAP